MPRNGMLTISSQSSRVSRRKPWPSPPTTIAIGASSCASCKLRGVSASAFGHMGAGGQIAWADPATGVSFAYLTNGLVRDPVQLGIRSDELSTAAGRCFEAPAEGHR